MNGSSGAVLQRDGGYGQSGVYGTLGVPAAGNVPGSRSGASSWTDRSGNLWLFGGQGYLADGLQVPLNDLWEFNPSSNLWTWMGGSDIWGQWAGVYGTLGKPATTNIPGGRSGAISWTDGDGHFWLFGGDGSDSTGFSGILNDLWEFNPTTKEWTWVSGKSAIPPYSGGNNGLHGWPGIYGNLGSTAPSNMPGGRSNAVAWIDGNGNLWLFGGEGMDSAGNIGSLNDLWAFNPVEKEWAWMGGSSVCGSNKGQPGIYGVRGSPSAANVPGGRSRMMSWVDGSGHFWLFGGTGFDSADTDGFLNDLWEYQ
jgi:N-acetylneuraminic acid mutarotase